MMIPLTFSFASCSIIFEFSGKDDISNENISSFVDSAGAIALVLLNH